MEPFDWVLKGQFQKAIEICTRKIRRKKDQWAFTTRAAAYVNIGAYEQALSDLAEAERLHDLMDMGSTDYFRQEIGMALWLQNRRAEAASVWRETVEAHKRGKIAYSDMAPGIESGVLLWFSSCYPEGAEHRGEAVKFLAKKIKSKRNRHWPGPIGRFVLGQISAAELKAAAREDCEGCSVLESRELCQACFYIGVMAISEGRKSAGKKELAEAVRLGKKTLIETEHYLAKHELQRL